MRDGTTQVSWFMVTSNLKVQIYLDTESLPGISLRRPSDLPSPAADEVSGAFRNQELCSSTTVLLSR